MSTTTFTQEGYSQKARGTHARVSRVKVTQVPRAGKPGSPLAFEKPSTTTSTPTGTTLTKNCVRCKESANCVKTLQTKLGKIEQLVRNLETSTTKYTDEKPSMHQQQQQQQQQPPQPQQLQLQLQLNNHHHHHHHHHQQQPSPPPPHHRHARLTASRKHPVMRPLHRGIDLSKLNFTEFQKLVAVTTNTPFPVAPPSNTTIITKLSTTEPMIDVKPTPAIHSDPQHYHISGGGHTKADPDDELPSSPALSSSTITSQITSTSATTGNVGHQSPPITAAMALKRQKSLRKDSGYTSDSDREHSNAPSRKHTLSSGLSQAESTNILI